MIMIAIIKENDNAEDDHDQMMIRKDDGNSKDRNSL